MILGGRKVDVPVSVSARLRIGGVWWISPRKTALLGIFAILFQAMLFAWHNHAHPLSLRSAPAALALAAANDDRVPTSSEDDCEFCFSLSHHSAAPIDFFAPAPPGPLRAHVTGEFLHNNVGIENPTGSKNAIHDIADQPRGFAYVAGIIDPNTRVSAILWCVAQPIPDP